MTAPRPTVVVTGLGATTPLGGTAEETARLSPEQWRTLRENYTLARRLGFARKSGHQVLLGFGTLQRLHNQFLLQYSFNYSNNSCFYYIRFFRTVK